MLIRGNSMLQYHRSTGQFHSSKMIEKLVGIIKPLGNIESFLKATGEELAWDCHIQRQYALVIYKVTKNANQTRFLLALQEVDADVLQSAYDALKSSHLPTFADRPQPAKIWLASPAVQAPTADGDDESDTPSTTTASTSVSPEEIDRALLAGQMAKGKGGGKGLAAKAKPKAQFKTNKRCTTAGSFWENHCVTWLAFNLCKYNL